MTIGILQTRHASVLAGLIERQGGRPLVAPTLREETIDELDPLRQVLERLAAEPVHLAIFQTGVGVSRLFDLAETLGLDKVLSTRLAETRVLTRGPKPLAVLLKRGVRVDLRTEEPHTTAQVLPLLEPDLCGRAVLVQHHGVPNEVLIDALHERGARPLEAVTYHWALPEDLAPVHRFFEELMANRVDVTLFTSASQVQNLFAIAEEAGCFSKLPGWLREMTMIASVGPTTTGALAEYDLTPVIQPEHPKMVPLVDAVCTYFSGIRAD
jgi:uroporphyrinogen-III synthase